jgi:flagellar biosynthesis protein FliQ
MDVVEGIITAGITVIALIVIIGLIAALFMFIFRLATDIDERIQS